MSSKYESTTVLLTEGDVITSKKGMLSKVNLTGKDEFFFVFKARYLGNDNWEALKQVPAENIRNVTGDESRAETPIMTRCSECHEFHPLPAGTPCPANGCLGVME